MTRYKATVPVERNEDGDDYIYDVDVTFEVNDLSETNSEDTTLNIIDAADENDDPFELTDDEKEELRQKLLDAIDNGEAEELPEGEIDNTLPIPPATIDNELPTTEGPADPNYGEEVPTTPDNELPESQPGIDNTVPDGRPSPDQDLPGTAEPR